MTTSYCKTGKAFLELSSNIETNIKEKGDNKPHRVLDYTTSHYQY